MDASSVPVVEDFCFRVEEFGGLKIGEADTEAPPCYFANELTTRQGIEFSISVESHFFHDVVGAVSLFPRLVFDHGTEHAVFDTAQFQAIEQRDMHGARVEPDREFHIYKVSALHPTAAGRLHVWHPNKRNTGAGVRYTQYRLQLIGIGETSSGTHQVIFQTPFSASFMYRTRPHEGTSLVPAEAGRMVRPTNDHGLLAFASERVKGVVLPTTLIPSDGVTRAEAKTGLAVGQAQDVQTAHPAQADLPAQTVRPALEPKVDPPRTQGKRQVAGSPSISSSPAKRPRLDSMEAELNTVLAACEGVSDASLTSVVLALLESVQRTSPSMLTDPSSMAILNTLASSNVEFRRIASAFLPGPQVIDGIGLPMPMPSDQPSIPFVHSSTDVPAPFDASLYRAHPSKDGASAIPATGPPAGSSDDEPRVLRTDSGAAILFGHAKHGDPASKISSFDAQ
jgi:hypothetical protein